MAASVRTPGSKIEACLPVVVESCLQSLAAMAEATVVDSSPQLRPGPPRLSVAHPDSQTPYTGSSTLDPASPATWTEKLDFWSDGSEAARGGGARRREERGEVEESSELRGGGEGSAARRGGGEGNVPRRREVGGGVWELGGQAQRGVFRQELDRGLCPRNVRVFFAK